MSLRVCLDARMLSGRAGGVQQALAGLASALVELCGDTEYVFLTYKGHDDWIARHAERSTILRVEQPRSHPAWRTSLRARLPHLHRLWRRLPPLPVRGLRVPAVPISDGVAEAAGVAVVHFTHQSGFLTELPTVYQPWDLQHLHLPELFSRREAATRELHYRTLCDQAAAIVVSSSYTRDDLVARYGIDAARVHVIAPGAPTEAYARTDPEKLSAARQVHSLPERFLFYPAQTYPHKNHMRLFDALAALRRRGVDVPVVCSGAPTAYFPQLLHHARRARVDDLVRFLGFVPDEEVQALYRLSVGVIFPTLFEGWGLPVLEAFRAEAPLACSNVTSLPALTAGAALLFDPRDVEAIAAAVERIWADGACREMLRERGLVRVADFDWKRTAMTFRALYQLVAGCSLDENDARLLKSTPVV